MDAKPVIQTTAEHLRVPPREEVQALRERFRRRHWVRLPRLLKPSVIDMLAPHFDETGFSERQSLYNRRDVSPRLAKILALVLSDVALFECVAKIIGGSRTIRSIAGGASRQTSSPRHYIDWHEDQPPFPPGTAIDATLVVNLGGSYQGGLLELKSARSARPVRIANARRGDAVLFRSSLLHRGTPVIGRKPKLTFIGWFSTAPVHSRTSSET